jgi:hypothetical protein
VVDVEARHAGARQGIVMRSPCRPSEGA